MSVGKQECSKQPKSLSFQALSVSHHLRGNAGGDSVITSDHDLLPQHNDSVCNVHVAAKHGSNG